MRSGCKGVGMGPPGPYGMDVGQGRIGQDRWDALNGGGDALHAGGEQGEPGAGVQTAGQGRGPLSVTPPRLCLQTCRAAGGSCTKSVAVPAAGPALSCAWRGAAPAPTWPGSASPAATAPRGWCAPRMGSASCPAPAPAATAPSSALPAARSAGAATPGAWSRGCPGAWRGPGRGHGGWQRPGRMGRADLELRNVAMVDDI